MSGPPPQANGRPAGSPPDASDPAGGADGQARKDSLIDFPSLFPIKVMGLAADGFEAAVVAVARHFDPDLDGARIERRPSSGGKYLGLTVTITATSREQLDELYRTLSTHPMVKVVL